MTLNKNHGSRTPWFWAMTPFLKGHGDSKYKTGKPKHVYTPTDDSMEAPGRTPKRNTLLHLQWPSESLACSSEGVYA